jgi:hypothetical protein
MPQLTASALRPRRFSIGELMTNRPAVDRIANAQTTRPVARCLLLAAALVIAGLSSF